MSKIRTMFILIESKFWWDFYETSWIGLVEMKKAGYRNGNYLPLETIDDLVYQFNYTGFNDLCIYPPWDTMAVYKDPSSKYTKGIFAVYSGHTNQNQTGK